MSSPDLALYVTSNDVDHGPLSLKEATKRVQSGEFKPTDLAWHQGVSGWIPMKDLPEWDAMQAPPPLEKKAPPPLIAEEKDLQEEEPEPQVTSPLRAKTSGDKPIRRAPANQEIEDNEVHDKPQGMGFAAKALIAFAILIFLSVLGGMVYFVIKNPEKFTQ